MNTYKIEIKKNRDYLLELAISRDIEKRWKSSLFAAKLHLNDFGSEDEKIDYLADILLQILKAWH